MPQLKDATDWQRAVVSGVAAQLGVQPQYTGPQDDCYKFTRGKIFGYLKLYAAVTRSTPRGGVKVIVEEKFWSQIRDDMEQGNDWYGKPSRHRVFAAEDEQALDFAASVLSSAMEHLNK